jgi:hypothetical protein
MILQLKFVEFIPNILEEGVIYISITYCTAVHKCVCGCGNEVVTPLSPTDWELTFNGESVSLYPSIGNWNFECKSHYWIIKNKVKFSRKWFDWEINFSRQSDSENKKKYFNMKKK